MTNNTSINSKSMLKTIFKDEQELKRLVKSIKTKSLDDDFTDKLLHKISRDLQNKKKENIFYLKSERIVYGFRYTKVAATLLILFGIYFISHLASSNQKSNTDKNTRRFSFSNLIARKHNSANTENNLNISSYCEKKIGEKVLELENINQYDDNNFIVKKVLDSKLFSEINIDIQNLTNQNNS
jgi:hypothetical protein